MAFNFLGNNPVPVLSVNLSGPNLPHNSPATLTPLTYQSITTVANQTVGFGSVVVTPANYHLISTRTGATSITVTVQDPPPIFLVSRTGFYQGQHAYTSIQAAINAAPAGALIEVAAGTYNQNVVVNKAVILQGAEFGQDAGTGRTNLAHESVINGSVKITASNIVFDGFTVQNSGGAAITIQPSVTADSVLQNVVQHSLSGLVINGAANADIADNRFNANANQNILVENHASGTTIEVNLMEGATADGIDVVKSNNNSIAANTITANKGIGVLFELANGNTLQNNTITGNSSNVVLQSSNSNILAGNTIEQSTGQPYVNRLGYTILVGSGWGIGLFTSAGNQITGNTVENNRAGSIDLIAASNSNIVSGNLLSGNPSGIVVTVSSGNTVSKNQIA
jgi:parallel beta-helix repeat protein